MTWLISALMATAGGYMMIARDDTRDLERRLNAVAIDIAGLSRDVEWLKRQERRER